MAHVQDAAKGELLKQSRQLAAIVDEPPTETMLQSPGYRAELAASLERVNLLAHVVTRTRKRDVQMERPRRVVTPESVPMTEAERRDFLEICDVRYQARSTLLTSQLPVANWHTQIGDPTIADSILDRLVHNAHRIELKGESMRRKRTHKVEKDNG